MKKLLRSYNKMINEPKKRLAQYEKYLKELVEEVIAQGIEIDKIPTKNPLNIFKIPLTLSNGKVCKIIPNNSLESPQLWKRAMKGVFPNFPTKRKGAETRTRTSVRPTIYFQANAISSSVCGVKNRSALILDYPESLAYTKRMVKKIIATYKTASFGIFETKNGYRVFCPEAFCWDRAKKILINSGSDKQFIRMYANKGFMAGRFSEKRELFTNEIISPAPKFVELVEGVKGKPCSKSHLAFLQNFTKINEEKLVGNSNISTIKYTGEE